MRFETRERSLLAGMRFAIFAIAAPDDQQQAPSEQPSEKRSGGASEVCKFARRFFVRLSSAFFVRSDRRPPQQAPRSA